ncbi:MAG: hypothetical protein HRT88_11730 [Lentisphaeraceae bacterium]|nr:hypothetical protein [Lentisphaeraceae bacterium]
MSVDPEDQFIEKIKSTLEKNGFPEKKVSLPLAKIQAVIDAKGLDLEMLLSRLTMFGIHSSISTEKIIFADSEITEETAPSAGGGMFDQLGGMGDMFKTLDLDSLKNMSKEELMSQVGKIMGDMSGDQKESMMDMYKNMSDEEKANIAGKAKDMGMM